MTYRNLPVDAHASVVNGDAQFVDVREVDEFRAGSLTRAVNIPLSELSDRLHELDSGLRTVLLCRSGGRSAQAAAFLGNNGFADVINLEGGMLAFNGQVA